MPEDKPMTVNVALNAPVLSRITIARLYNLGNYEHLRYELTLDVPPGEDPLSVLHAGHAAIEALRPIPVPDNVTWARRILSKQASDLTAQESLRLEECRRVVAVHEENEAKRRDRLKLFTSLGGAEQFKDAKSSWADSYDEQDDNFDL